MPVGEVQEQITYKPTGLTYQGVAEGYLPR